MNPITCLWALSIPKQSGKLWSMASRWRLLCFVSLWVMIAVLCTLVVMVSLRLGVIEEWMDLMEKRIR